MKIYRSPELGAKELSEKLSAEKDLEFFYEPMSQENLLKSDYDVIELTEPENENILSGMVMLDWNIQTTQATDAFGKQQNRFIPIHLSSTAFKSFLESKKISLDTSRTAVLIGHYSFLATYAVALAKLGFRKIYLVSADEILFTEKISALKKYLFDVELKQISFDEMANISELSSLLVTDFLLGKSAELVEILTYFNFVAEGAVFFDLQNYLDDSLSSEAEKASMKVLDSVEFHLHKYRFYQKNLK